MQQQNEVQRLRSQVKAFERRALEAEAKTNQMQRQLQSWKNLQAEAVRSLSTEWNSYHHSMQGTGQPCSEFLHDAVPHNSSINLEFQSASPASNIKQAGKSSSATNPVHIFRQVYRDKAQKQQSPPTHDQQGVLCAFWQDLGSALAPVLQVENGSHHYWPSVV